MRVNFGVDPHKDSHELAACDQLGQKLSSAEFANTEDGATNALRWILGFEGELLIGVECSGSFGAVLTRRLVQAGLEVREVPSLLTHTERKRRPSQGKSDPVDALAIARAVALGESLALPKLADIFEELKLLVDERKSLVKRKTQLVNKTHSDLVILRAGYHRAIPKLTRKRHILKAKGARGRRSVDAGLVG